MTGQGDTLSNVFPGPDDDKPDTLDRTWNFGNAGQFLPSMLTKCWRSGHGIGVCNKAIDPNNQLGLCAEHLEELRN